jgi:hypothetical protein
MFIAFSYNSCGFFFFLWHWALCFPRHTLQPHLQPHFLYIFYEHETVIFLFMLSCWDARCTPVQPATDGEWILGTFCLGWHWTTILRISTSWVPRIAGVSHYTQLILFFKCVHEFGSNVLYYYLSRETITVGHVDIYGCTQMHVFLKVISIVPYSSFLILSLLHQFCSSVPTLETFHFSHCTYYSTLQFLFLCKKIDYFIICSLYIINI